LTLHNCQLKNTVIIFTKIDVSPYQDIEVQFAFLRLRYFYV